MENDRITEPVMIHHCIIDDKEISLQAKAVYLYVKSFLPEHLFNKYKMAEDLGISENSLNKYLRKLEQYRYIRLLMIYRNDEQQQKRKAFHIVWNENDQRFSSRMVD